MTGIWPVDKLRAVEISLERTPDGARYRVGFPPGTAAFELAVYELDLPATVAAYRAYLASRPRRAPSP